MKTINESLGLDFFVRLNEHHPQRNKLMITDLDVCRAAVYDFTRHHASLSKYDANTLARAYLYARDMERSGTEWNTPLKATTVRDLMMVAGGVPQSRRNTYRISIKPTHVELFHLGLDGVIDADEDVVYSSVDALPKWVQERLATLMLMKYEPPTSEVEGIGKRISQNIFWVYKPEDGESTSVSV